MEMVCVQPEHNYWTYILSILMAFDGYREDRASKTSCSEMEMSEEQASPQVEESETHYE